MSNLRWTVIEFPTNMFFTKPTRCKVKNSTTLQDDKKIQNVEYFSSLQSNTIVLYVGCHRILTLDFGLKFYCDITIGKEDRAYQCSHCYAEHIDTYPVIVIPSQALMELINWVHINFRDNYFLSEQFLWLSKILMQNPKSLYLPKNNDFTLQNQFL